ncbi:universal stress protein [soil metagenome]
MKIVVAIDGADSAKSALAELVAKKYSSDTEIHLVHVIVPGFANVSTPGLPDSDAIEVAEEIQILEKLAADLKGALNITASAEILRGEVAQVIADACKQHAADEALVPSHARHGFARLWFGSIADEIVDAAPCTVVVLKMPESKKA